MAHTRSTSIAIAVLAAAAAGCGASPAARFYTLNPTASATGAPGATYVVGVGPVSIPAAVDRPQFVTQVAANRVEIDEFSRWAAPLDEAIARAVAGNLIVLLGTPNVVVGPLASVTPDYRVAIDVQRFESLPADAVVIDAAWVVRRAAGQKAQAGRTTAREPVQDASADALAAAHSRALARMSAEIAAAIRDVAARSE